MLDTTRYSLSIPLGLFLAAGAPPQPEVLSASYLRVVVRYARGEREAAVAEIKSWSLEQLQWELRPVARLAGYYPRDQSRPSWVLAAAMLHTDAAWAGLPCVSPTAAQVEAALVHFRIARAAPGREDAAVFARRWYLANTFKALWAGCVTEAGEWARAALASFPKDVELLVALAISEEIGTSSVYGEPTPEQRLRLERAERALREARRLAPERRDVGVRFGHVVWRLGKAEEAQRVFEAVVTADDDPEATHFAHLALGRIHEGQNRLREAVREYEGSLARAPACQTAGVALSHALFLLGDGPGAVAALDAALARAPRKGDPADFCWRYAFGASPGAEDLFADLRAEASR